MNNLVLITSVICIENNPLSYTNIRSVYSHKLNGLNKLKKQFKQLEKNT